MRDDMKTAPGDLYVSKHSVYMAALVLSRRWTEVDGVLARVLVQLPKGHAQIDEIREDYLVSYWQCLRRLP